MSYALQSRIYDIHLKPNLKHMLLTLATWASDDGTDIYPSKERIEHRSSYSRKNVKRLMKELIELGYLFCVGIHAKYKTKIYIINVDKLSPKEENNGQSVPESGQSVPESGQSVTPLTDNLSQKVDNMTPKSISNQNKSSSNNQSINHQAPKTADEDEDFLNFMDSEIGQLFLKAYKRIAKQEEIPQLNQMIDQPHGPAKLTIILNRFIAKSTKPKVIKYLVTAFNDEPTPIQIKSDTPTDLNAYTPEHFEQRRQERESEELRTQSVLDQKFTINKHWESTKEHLQTSMDCNQFETWILPTRFLEQDDNKFVIGTTNSFVCDMLQYRIYDQIQPALAEIVGNPIQIEFRVCTGMTA